MNKLKEQVTDIKAIIDRYWDAYIAEPYKGDVTVEPYMGNEYIEPSREFVERIDSLVSEYGYRKVADAFGIVREQYSYLFNEYTTDVEFFEIDWDILPGEDDEFYGYKAYCRWRPYWPVLISGTSMKNIKEYQNRVRHCHGDFFTLRKCKLLFASAVFNRFWEWEANAFDWEDDDCQYLIDTNEIVMTDADFELMHAKFQRIHIKSIVLELINNSRELPIEAIKAYTLCKTRSVTPEGWGADVYVLSESDRVEIIRALEDKVGADTVENLFGEYELNLALGKPTDGLKSEYSYFYLWGIDNRENAFGIFFNENEHFTPSYLPEVDIGKHLLPEFPIKKLGDSCWIVNNPDFKKSETGEKIQNADDEIPF